MTGSRRREQISELLSDSSSPLTGAVLASRFGVSRQVIVHDIALLRAANHCIIATTSGCIKG